MEWITRAKQRGWGGWLLVLIDVLEPFAPLIGQSLFVAAPLFSPLGARQHVEQLGHLLDDPAGLAYIRAHLEDDHAG